MTRLDNFRVAVSSDGGATWVNLINSSDDWEYWLNNRYLLENCVTLSNQEQLRAIAEDADASLLEAAVDDVCLVGIIEVPPPPQELTIYYLPGTNEYSFHWQPSPGAGLYTLCSGAEPDGPFDFEEDSTSDTTLTRSATGSLKRFYVVVASEGVVASRTGSGVPTKLPLR